MINSSEHNKMNMIEFSEHNKVTMIEFTDGVHVNRMHDSQIVSLSIGCMYSEKPGTLSSPNTLGLLGLLKSITNRGSTCNNM